MGTRITMRARARVEDSFIDVEWIYDPQDPLVVYLDCLDPDSNTVIRWTVGRDLLLAAASAGGDPIGEGDIQVTFGKRCVVNLRGFGDDGHQCSQHLRFRADRIRWFLENTLLEVPYQSEEIDIDGWLAEVLGG